MKPSERLLRSRLALILDEPFFGTLLLNLKVIEDHSIPTFCTNGKDLRYSPQFMDSLDDLQLKTVLAHEVLHCGLLHPYRRDQRDPRRFNEAADYAINNYLQEYIDEAVKANRPAPFTFKGLNGLLDPKYRNMSAEEIYNLLPPPPPGGGGGSGKSGKTPGGEPPASCGEFTDGAKDEAEADAMESQWKITMKQALMAAKSMGRLPAGFGRLIEEYLEPKVHWREVLRTLLTSCANDDYTWRRPNRRFSGSGVIMPSLHSPRMGTIVVAIDTSGSITQAELTEFISETRGILFDCRPSKLVLVQCDAAVHEWTEYDNWQGELNFELKGGGGTDFRPVFDRIAEEAEPPAALVFLTDLAGSFPEQEPGYTVIWAANTEGKAPFGETIYIK